MKNKVLTYEELIALAQKNYCHGGMDVAECWDRVNFDDYVKEFGPMTKEGAIKMFHFYEEIDREEEAIRTAENW